MFKTNSMDISCIKISDAWRYGATRLGTTGARPQKDWLMILPAFQVLENILKFEWPHLGHLRSSCPGLGTRVQSMTQ